MKSHVNYIKYIFKSKSVGDPWCNLGTYQSLFLYLYLISSVLLGIDFILFLGMINVLIKGPWNIFGVSLRIIHPYVK